MMSEPSCRNCGALLSGEYCASCGQRRFRPQHRRLGHLLGEGLGALTDLDGRFWRSLRAALLQPGRIARDYIDGRRASWISPIRLFLMANLLYFIAPVMTDLSLPLHNQAQGAIYREFAPTMCKAPATAWKCRGGGQAHSAHTGPQLRNRLQREQALATQRGEEFSLAAFEQRYNARSEAIGKVLVILHVPFIAAILALAAWRSRRYYAEHFVVALGLVTFLLLFVQLVMNPAAWLYDGIRAWLGASGSGMPGFALIGLLLVMATHLMAACRRSYDSQWWIAMGQGLLALIALGATSIYIYRPVQFLLALWTM